MPEIFIRGASNSVGHLFGRGTREWDSKAGAHSRDSGRLRGSVFGLPGWPMGIWPRGR